MLFRSLRAAGVAVTTGDGEAAEVTDFLVTTLR